MGEEGWGRVEKRFVGWVTGATGELLSPWRGCLGPMLAGTEGLSPLGIKAAFVEFRSG